MDEMLRPLWFLLTSHSPPKPYTHVHIYTQTHKDIRSHTLAHRYTYKCTYRETHMQTDIQTDTGTQRHTETHRHTEIHAHRHIHTYTETHIDTYTQTCFPFLWKENRKIPGGLKEKH